MVYVVRNVLPQLESRDSLIRLRTAKVIKGNILCHDSHDTIYQDILETMGVDILPYLVLFIVPIMGAMSDMDKDVRMSVSTSFAKIVKLLPLEVKIYFSFFFDLKQRLELQTQKIFQKIS